MAQFRIVGGPSKWDMAVSLLDGDFNHRRVVYFQLESRSFLDKLEVALYSLAREDGSGDRWMFEAYISSTNPFADRSKRVKGYYDLTTRRGWIEQVTH